VLSRIARLERDSKEMVRDPQLPIRAGTLPFHLEPEDWRAGYLRVREYELPGELFADLAQNAPQALLRDLYRPEYEAFVWHERETQVVIDYAGTRALRAAREAQVRDPLPTVEPLVHEVMQHAADWRQVVRTPWKPILADSEKRKRVMVVHDPSQNW
jgi:hypothetical protein